MTERDALLSAILDDPSDDTVRLVYADFLDDTAESPSDMARAEFIRLQVFLGLHNRYRDVPNCTCSECDSAYHRCNSLLVSHGQAWLKQSFLGFGYMPECLISWTYRRGFLEPPRVYEQRPLRPKTEEELAAEAERRRMEQERRDELEAERKLRRRMRRAGIDSAIDKLKPKDLKRILNALEAM